MTDTLDVVFELWPFIIAGIAIFGLCILIFVVSSRMFYFRRRVRRRDYKIKDTSFDNLDAEELNDKEQEILSE